MKIKELADMAGISVRTLHHYDSIGLLVPSIDSENGYRNYTDSDISKLQQILFFRQLNFKLTQIKEIVESREYDTLTALEAQKTILLQEQQRLKDVVALIDKTIKTERGEMTMTNEEKFKGVDFSRNPYESEARERWGNEAVDKSNKKLKEMDTKAAEEKFDEIFTNLAAVRHLDPDSVEAEEHIQKWYDFLNEMGEYSLEMFKGLGDMYVDDERFTKNINKYGEGLAEFMQQAMTAYYEKYKK